MKFTKMNGLGNDFIVVAHLEQLPDNVEQLAEQMCDRHFGVGADGLVFILPSDKADVTMRIINADGSEAEQCGNAIRCVAKYAYDYGMVKKKELAIQTLAGIQYVWLELDNEGKVNNVKVDMGPPILEHETDKEKGTTSPIQVNGREFNYTSVSMGNPHAVTFVDDAVFFDVEKWGPLIEKDQRFPNKTNVEFVTVKSSSEVDMRVWERGVGQTLACGTGACAVAVAGALNDKTGRHVLVHLKGGDLFIEWDEKDNHVYMTGPAEQVFKGEWLK